MSSAWILLFGDRGWSQNASKIVPFDASMHTLQHLVRWPWKTSDQWYMCIYEGFLSLGLEIKIEAKAHQKLCHENIKNQVWFSMEIEPLLDRSWTNERPILETNLSLKSISCWNKFEINFRWILDPTSLPKCCQNDTKWVSWINEKNDLFLIIRRTDNSSIWEAKIAWTSIKKEI